MWLRTKASTLARLGYRPVRGEKGEIRAGKGDADPGLFLALTGLGERVYCRKWEVGKQGGGSGEGLAEGQRGACPIASSWLSLFVCLSSHCGNQFALCGTVDTERERLPGGLAQEKQQQTQAETTTGLRQEE